MTEPAGTPFDRADARQAADAAFAVEGAQGAELVVVGSTTGLTRYANSEVIQNTVRREVNAYVRVEVDGCVATASTNQLTPERVRRAADRAAAAARSSPPDPDWPGLADPARVGRPEPLFRWDPDTAEASPAARADSVTKILDVAGDESAAGVFETSAHSYAVMNSRGVDCFDAYTRCVASSLVESGGTGWGEASSFARGHVDVAQVAQTALDKAIAGRDPVESAPGTYEVVLEPSAVATILEYFSYMGLGAKQVFDKESFLAEKAGEKVGADSVSVVDDVGHELSVGIGFDFDGAPRTRVATIDAGVATGPVTDLRYANKMGLELTGHSSGSATFGPWAANLVMPAGSEPRRRMIEGVKRGLLVTRFHYVNILHQPSTLLTGMTRDGVFEIVDGEVGRPVHNFRFTQSVLDALASVIAVGDDAAGFAPEYGGFGSTVAPSLRIGEFGFTSTTLH